MCREVGRCPLAGNEAQQEKAHSQSKKKARASSVGQKQEYLQTGRGKEVSTLLQ